MGGGGVAVASPERVHVTIEIEKAATQILWQAEHRLVCTCSLRVAFFTRRGVQKGPYVLLHYIEVDPNNH